MKKIVMVAMALIGLAAGAFAYDGADDNTMTLTHAAGNDWTADETYVSANYSGCFILIRQGITGSGIYINYDNYDDLNRNYKKACRLLEQYASLNGGEKAGVHPSWMIDEDNAKVQNHAYHGEPIYKNIDIVD